MDPRVPSLVISHRRTWAHTHTPATPTWDTQSGSRLNCNLWLRSKEPCGSTPLIVTPTVRTVSEQRRATMLSSQGFVVTAATVITLLGASSRVAAQTPATDDAADTSNGSGTIPTSTIVVWVAIALASLAGLLFSVCLLQRYKRKRNERQLSFADIDKIPERSGDDIAQDAPGLSADTRRWGAPTQNDMYRFQVDDTSGYITVDVPALGEQGVYGRSAWASSNHPIQIVRFHVSCRGRVLLTCQLHVLVGRSHGLAKLGRCLRAVVLSRSRFRNQRLMCHTTVSPPLDQIGSDKSPIVVQNPLFSPSVDDVYLRIQPAAPHRE